MNIFLQDSLKHSSNFPFAYVLLICKSFVECVSLITCKLLNFSRIVLFAPFSSFYSLAILSTPDFTYLHFDGVWIHLIIINLFPQIHDFSSYLSTL